MDTDAINAVVSAVEGEPGRYHVKSLSETGTHMVDLRNWDFRGECTCKDWEIRVGFFLKKDEEPQKPCCKHIHLARQKLVLDNFDQIPLYARLAKVILSQTTS